MARKTKRPSRIPAKANGEKTAPDVLTGNRPTGFNPDYHFVIRDVRRVGILAGSFIVILVALSFFLH